MDEIPYGFKKESPETALLKGDNNTLNVKKRAANPNSLDNSGQCQKRCVSLGIVGVFLIGICLFLSIIAITRIPKSVATSNALPNSTAVRLEQLEKLESIGKPIPNVGNAFRGYNILLGNPFHADTNGDPGFQSPIFKTLHLGKTTGDTTYDLPDGLDGFKKPICKLDSQSKTISNEKSYQKDLSEKTGSTFGIGKLADVAYTANKEFKTKTSKMSKSKSFFVKSETECNVFELILDQHSPPKFTNGFLAAVRRLEDVNDQAAYLSFVKSFGTHYLSSIHMGAMYAIETEFESHTRDELSSEGFNFERAAKLHFKKIQLGMNFSSQKKVETTNKYEESTQSESILFYGPAIPEDGDMKKWTHNVFENPLPIRYKLREIQSLFTETFMESLVPKPAYKKINKTLNEFLDQYCISQKKSLGIASCTGLDGGCAGGNDCHRNARCNNTFEGYKCTCNDGYEGDGRTCSGWRDDYEIA